MPELVFNGSAFRLMSENALAGVLRRFDRVPSFELWLELREGPALCMLRNGDDAWLLYREGPESPGYCSLGDASRRGVAQFRLPSGEIDEYPRAWCIGPEACYRAMQYFCRHRGARPPLVNWQ